MTLGFSHGVQPWVSLLAVKYVFYVQVTSDYQEVDKTIFSQRFEMFRNPNQIELLTRLAQPVLVTGC